MSKEKSKLDYINYRISKSKESLEEANILLQSGHLATCMNIIYYSAFYIVSPLLELDNFSTSKHKHLIGYFNRNYMKEGLIDVNIGKTINDAYDKRISVDYHDFATITKSDINDYMREVKKFNKEVKALILKKN